MEKMNELFLILSNFNLETVDLEVSSSEEMERIVVEDTFDNDADAFSIDARTAAALVNNWHSENCTLSIEQAESSAKFWNTLSPLCFKAPKAIALSMNRRFENFLSAPISINLHSSKLGADAAAAVSFYFALVRVPGAQAFGAFDVNVMRRSLSVIKRFFELAISSAPGAQSANVTKSSRMGKVSQKNNPSILSTRSNPRRAVSSTASTNNTALEKEDGENDLNNQDDFDDDDDDEEDTVVKVKRTSSRTVLKRKIGGESSKDTNTISFMKEDVALLESMLKDDFFPLLCDFSFVQNQELIPFAIDVIASVLTLPMHICSLSVPPSLSDLTHERSLLVSAGESLLALLQSKHTSPLTTTRLALKKLKPFMLHGHGGTGVKASAANNAVSSTSELEEALTAAGALPETISLDLRRPACPPEVRIIRARALYLTRVLISDKVSGRVVVTLSSSGDDSFEESLGASSTSSTSSAHDIPHPIPQTVLERLPAVTALLEHLCVGAVGAKADSRAIACDIITHLRACLPHSLRRAFIRFLASMAKAAKAGYRLVATEIAARLLGSKSGSGDIGVSEATALDVLGVNESNAPTLALTLSELPRPSRDDKIVESAGYGRDGADYAMGATANGENVQEGGGSSHESFEQLSSPIESVRSNRSRRSSILLMGADNAHTPLRSAFSNNVDDDEEDEEDEDNEESFVHTKHAVKNAKSKIKKSSGARATQSPFYKSLAGANPRSSVLDDIDGCCDPRPTAMILIDLLFRRASDRAPGVRARAVAAIAGLIDHQDSVSSQNNKKRSQNAARFLAHLLAHCAHTQALSEYAVDEAMDGGVMATTHTTGDVTLPGSHNTSFGAQYALYVSSSSALSSTINASQTDVIVIQSEPSATVPSPLVPLLVRRMHDVKPAVRKAALQASASIALNGGAGSVIHSNALVDHATALALKEENSPDLLSWHTLQNINCTILRKAKALAVENTDNSAPSGVLGLYCLQSISSAASDASILVRRQALCSFQALLLAEPQQPALQSLWLATVLPLVLDSEQSVSSKSVECIREAIINELLSWHAVDKQTSSQAKPSLLVWKLLDSCANDSDLSRCLSQAVQVMSRVTGELPVEKLIVALLHGAKASEEVERLDQLSPVAEIVRKGSLLLLEILSAHFAVKAVTSGGTSVAAATCITAAHSSSSYSLFKPVIPFLIRSWDFMLKAMRSNNRDDSHSQFILFTNAARVLRILASLAPGISSDQFQTLVDSVVNELQRFIWTSEVISAGVRLVATLSASHAPTGQLQVIKTAVETWALPLQASIEERLRSFVVTPSNIANNATSLSSALFTLGEISLIGLDADAGQGATDTSSSSSSEKETRRRMIGVTISERLITLVQSLMAPALTPAVASNTTLSNPIVVPEGVRALAYLCIGKICLRDVSLAKRFIAVLVRDLSPKLCTSAAVRNNVLFVLGDLCLRYTSLVDRHVDAITEAIADPNGLVRRHAVSLITQLVTSDYLKWRAMIFYRFAIAISDSDEGVRNAALGSVTGVLLTKNKLILQAHFVDLVFVLSGCTSRVAYHQIINSSKALKPSTTRMNTKVNTKNEKEEAEEEEDEDEDVEIDIAENSSFSTSNDSLSQLAIPSASRRMFIYRTLLAAMPEEQRFTVHGKLAVEVLGGLLEGTSLKLTPPAQLAQQMQQLRNTNASQYQQRNFPTTPGASSRASESNRGSDSSSSLSFPPGSTEALVAEVFSILSCPDMRVGASKGTTGGSTAKDDDEDGINAGGGGEDEQGTQASSNVMMVQSLALAKSRLMSKLAKKQAVENVLPICIGLKQLFSLQKSPLRVPLMHYLVGLFHDFGEDLREVLSADRQTAAELEFDLRQFQLAESQKASLLTELDLDQTPFGAVRSGGGGGGGQKERRRISLFERVPLSTPAFSEVQTSPKPKVRETKEEEVSITASMIVSSSPSICALEENTNGRKTKKNIKKETMKVKENEKDAPPVVVVLNNAFAIEEEKANAVTSKVEKGGKRSRRLALQEESLGL
jgi:hypothetical protein